MEEDTDEEDEEEEEEDEVGEATVLARAERWAVQAENRLLFLGRSKPDASPSVSSCSCSSSDARSGVRE